MTTNNNADALKLRYIIGLSVIALLVTLSFVTMQRVVSKQRGYFSLVNLAGHQAGLTNRIAYFAGLMVSTDDETEFEMARSQVGLTVNKMKHAHAVLRSGSPENGIPVVMTDTLANIYADPMAGLDTALERFWERVDAIHESDMETLTSHSVAYIYLTTYGPHVLEPLLDTAVDEYEKIGRAAIVRIERFELAIWLATIVTLFLEIIFIFRPLEKSIRKTIRSLENSVTELTATRTRLLAAQRLALVGDWQYRLKEGKLNWSEQIYDICGVSKETFVATLESSFDLIHPEDRQEVRTSMQRVRKRREPLLIEYRIVRPDGAERLVHQQVVVTEDGAGRLISLSGTIQDISERKELSTRLEKLSENIPGLIYQFHYNPKGSYRFAYVSNGIMDTYGIEPANALRHPKAVFDLIHAEDLPRVTRTMLSSLKKLQTWHDQYRIHHPVKGEIWIEGHATPERLTDGSTIWYGYSWDISERKRYEDQIRQLALYDPLTGLANRRLLHDRLSHAMATARRTRSFGAVLMLDMDNFKTLNDTQGHDTGDALLVEVGRRLRGCVRDTDTIARLGGDEFVVILEWLGVDEAEGRSKSLAVAEKIRLELGRKYILGSNDHVHHASASIGIVLFQGHETSDGELLKQADVAMFEAKDLGRNRACVFSEERQAIINTRSAIVSDLQHALGNDEFSLYYQPQISRAGGVCGAEALLRWFPTGKNPVSPATFIPIAEETGLILPLGEWVLEKVCKHLLALGANNLPHDFAVAVNISARQFSDDDFLRKVKRIIDHSGVEVHCLKFELTESSLIHDLNRGQMILQALAEMGLRIELDDFGTGYSSLTSLKRLPLNTLKLDSSMVHGIAGDARDEAILSAAIAMAKALSLTIIAEGVETEQQRQFLIREGCDVLQGFLFARPMPFVDFVKYLQDYKPAGSYPTPLPLLREFKRKRVGLA